MPLERGSCFGSSSTFPGAFDTSALSTAAKDHILSFCECNAESANHTQKGVVFTLCLRFKGRRRPSFEVLRITAPLLKLKLLALLFLYWLVSYFRLRFTGLGTLPKIIIITHPARMGLSAFLAKLGAHGGLLISALFGRVRWTGSTLHDSLHLLGDTGHTSM